MVKEEMDLAEQYKQLADELETKIEVKHHLLFDILVLNSRIFIYWIIDIYRF